MFVHFTIHFQLGRLIESFNKHPRAKGPHPQTSSISHDALQYIQLRRMGKTNTVRGQRERTKNRSFFSCTIHTTTPFFFILQTAAVTSTTTVLAPAVSSFINLLSVPFLQGEIAAILLTLQSVIYACVSFNHLYGTPWQLHVLLVGKCSHKKQNKVNF